jgi:hypothetical protein
LPNLQFVLFFISRNFSCSDHRCCLLEQKARDVSGIRNKKVDHVAMRPCSSCCTWVGCVQKCRQAARLISYSLQSTRCEWERDEQYYG